MLDPLCVYQSSKINNALYHSLNNVELFNDARWLVFCIIGSRINLKQLTLTLLIKEQLNLIMFYHNYRRYRDGKRKNKTPMELLTGKQQTEDWIALVFDKIREKDPELLLAS